MTDEDYLPLLLSGARERANGWWESLGKFSEWDSKGWELEIGWVDDTCSIYWTPKEHPEEGMVIFTP